MSSTRPYVDAFADEMEAKLAQNRDKGDREGWARLSVDVLVRRLYQECEELGDELYFADATKTEVGRTRIRRECADVANFAMMIADVAGGMKPKHGGTT